MAKSRHGHPYNLKITKHPKNTLKHIHFAISPHQVLPASVDLRTNKAMPPVYDQGQLGSCTANSLGSLIQFNDGSFGTPSRLFIYYNERKMEGDIPDDNGAELSDGVKSLQKWGVCPETEWPYIINKFATAPPAQTYTDALKHRAIVVQSIHDDAQSMKSALALGHPFCVGISVFESFESDAVAASGVVPMPNQATEQNLGGHAVAVVGYDDHKQVWILRNSWGSGWGQHGYFTLPYAYLLDPNLASDMWVITSVTKKA